MDNAAFHKGKDMQNMITESGHILLYLHTYSPDLNPIEKKWAQAKKLRRSLQCNIDQLFKSYLL
jgi:transposase